VLHVPAKAFIPGRALLGDSGVERLEPPPGHGLLEPGQLEVDHVEVAE
jgi:hypothetical protein